VEVRSRYWLAAALGLWMAHPLVGSEPARLGVAPDQPLCPRQTLSTNQQLANTIARQLRQSGHLRHYTIDIAFADGVAELTGTVADQPQHEEVLRIVQGVPGVDRVRDRIQLSGAGPVAQTLAFGDNNNNNSNNSGPEVTPQPRRNPLADNAGNGGKGPIVEPTPVFQAPPGPYDLNPPKMPPYAWPTYAPYNNFARVGYPEMYPYQSWPFIGPMYPFPKVPLGWRSVKLHWEDGHWWYIKTACGHDWWRVRYW
jgi:hypothetical protein